MSTNCQGSHVKRPSKIFWCNAPGSQGYSQENWVGVSSPLPKTLPYWIMFTVGSVGRYIDRDSADMSTECRPLLGRHIVRDSTGCRPIYRRMCVSTHTVLVSSTLGRYLIDTLPIVCRYLTDNRSILGRLSASRVSVDMSVVNSEASDVMTQKRLRQTNWNVG